MCGASVHIYVVTFNPSEVRRRGGGTWILDISFLNNIKLSVHTIMEMIISCGVMVMEAGYLLVFGNI